jgi:hypothetical protein
MFAYAQIDNWDEQREEGTFAGIKYSPDGGDDDKH